MSQDEARKISLLSRFVVSNIVVRVDKDFLAKEGLPFGFILEMQELGVIAGVESATLSMNLTTQSQADPGFVNALLSHGRALIVTHPQKDRIARLPAYQVTRLGREVLQLGTFEPHLEYLRMVGSMIKQDGFDVLLTTYTRLTENSIHYSTSGERL